MDSRDRIKVVFIAAPYEKGGAIEAFLSMVEALRVNYNIRPIILSSRKGRNNVYATEKGIENHVIGHTAFYVNEGSTWQRRFIRKILFPILWIRHFITNSIAVKRAERHIDFNQVDIIHSNTDTIDVGALLSKRHGILHVWHIRQYGESDYKCFSLRRNYIAFMNDNASMFIAVSRSVKKHWNIKGISENKIRVVYDGVDTHKFSPKENKEHKPGIVRLVISGFVAPQKGQLQLIQAISMMSSDEKKRLRLDIYGHGAIEYITYLKRMVKKNGIESVVCFKGMVNNINEILPDYDIGFTCSRSEAFGLVTIEYMMSGLCVVASDTGANRELVIDGSNGLIYKYGDIEMLKNAILRLVADEEMRIRIKNNNPKYARDMFSHHLNAKRIAETYSEVLHG